MVQIYVLKLENGNYYVGKSNTIRSTNTRILKHVSGNGSEWCKLHKPIDVEIIFYDCDDFDEDKYTKMYMKKYGIDKVRGGSYCQINLDKQQKILLNKEIKGAKDLCFKCDGDDHFIKDCKTIDSNEKCQRCGRNSHTVDDCYAAKHIKGHYLNEVQEEHSSNLPSIYEGYLNNVYESMTKILAPLTPRITTGTAYGEYLKKDVHESITKTLALPSDEKIGVVYMRYDTFDQNFSISREIIVGITDVRIFKIETGNNNQQLISNIASVSHQKNGLFSWDKVVCRLKNGDIDTYGIYHSAACGYFCDYLKNRIV